MKFGKKPDFAPRMPQEMRTKIRTGGAHRDKKAHDRNAEKRELQRQLRNLM